MIYLSLWYTYSGGNVKHLFHDKKSNYTIEQIRGK